MSSAPRRAACSKAKSCPVTWALRVTIQNLTVAKVDPENNLIAIKGAVPGPKGAVVCISDSVKA